MRNLLKSKLNLFITLAFAFSILLLTGGQVAAQSVDITLDHVVGTYFSDDTIFCDQPIEFHLRLKNNYMENVGEGGAGAVFRVYSPDGAVWTPITMDTLPLPGMPGWKQMFDGLVNVGVYGASGSGSDTGCFWGFAVFGSGLIQGFDRDSWIIYTMIDCSQEGKTICLDSVTTGEPPCDWLWAGSEGATFPIWNGPYCYTISPCCTGLRGNVDLNGGDLPNIIDLTNLVGFLFRGSVFPPCPGEADVNSDGTPANILDLTFLVDYIFRSGPLPSSCS